jgi:RsiW-degrading membrane proteinase PrsW (M82 family)
MVLKWFWRGVAWVLTALVSSVVGAQSVANPGGGGGVSVGTVASNLTGASDVFTGVFSAVFYVIGIALVVASVIRYREYRQNSAKTPISRVLFFLIAGIVIGFFPIAVNFIGHHI